MKIVILLITFCFTFSGLSHVGETANIQFTFADIKTGQDILTADDNYMNRMSPAEIAIRTQSTTADKTTDDLKAQYRANVLEWTEAEKAQITQMVENNRERMTSINHLLPGEIIFIKVNNKVEGGMPHTRGNAIILPRNGNPLSEILFYHELFHLLSRNQKARHHELYDLIGFKPCDLATNSEISAKSLTNPDVPAEGYYLPVEIDGRASAVMTFLHAAKAAYDPEVKGGFGGHFGFGLLDVAVKDGKCSVETDADGKARILDPGAVPEFFAAIGKNTGYIIHPEEVLADNFVFVMLEKEALPNPEIPDRLKAWLK